MDGNFYLDSRNPFLAASATAISLAATDKALVPIALLPVLPGNYFGFVGKAIWLRMFGHITTGATPGTGAFTIYWGSGADATGTNIGTTTTITLNANQTQLSWELNIIVRCRAMGSNGSLVCCGRVALHPSIASNGQTVLMIPDQSLAPVFANLTTANVISPQFKRSGSTAETMQVHDVSFVALN